MTHLLLSGIFIYPVKSLAGISANSWPVTGKGFQHDRKWMIIDNDRQFLSQRKLPKMALIKTALTDKNLILSAPGMENLFLPLEPVDGEIITAPSGMTSAMPVASLRKPTNGSAISYIRIADWSISPMRSSAQLIPFMLNLPTKRRFLMVFHSWLLQKIRWPHWIVKCSWICRWPVSGPIWLFPAALLTLKTAGAKSALAL